MTNRTYTYWAVTMPDWHRGKLVGRRADYTTLRLMRREAIAAWKADWPPDQADAMWNYRRKEHDYRVKRVTVTVEDQKND